MTVFNSSAIVNCYGSPKRYFISSESPRMAVSYCLILEENFQIFLPCIMSVIRSLLIVAVAFLGFCVSGHKIHDLLDRIRRRDVYKHVSSEVVLMIGTNDLLQVNIYFDRFFTTNYPTLVLYRLLSYFLCIQETEVEQMCAGIESLIFELLRKCRVEKLIVLTIPPVPRLRYEKDHWDRLNCYNDFVRSFDKRNYLNFLSILLLLN